MRRQPMGASMEHGGRTILVYNAGEASLVGTPDRRKASCNASADRRQRRVLTALCWPYRNGSRNGI